MERVAAPVREQVEDLLREAIVAQRLVPGQRLIERELVTWLGVSRTTVREALRHLAAEGLVKTVPQKGVVVAMPTRKEAEELYELRGVLEGLVARRFTERATPEQVEALKAAFARTEQVLLQADDAPLQDKMEVKDAFYRTLIQGAGNGTVQGVLEQLQARISVLRATSLSTPGRNVRSVAEIRRLVDAIADGDAAAASEAAVFHVRQAAEALFQAIDANAEAAPVLSGADAGAGQAMLA